MTSPVFNDDEEDDFDTDDQFLYDADPSCDHKIRAKGLHEGGGIECVKCKGWFCY